MEKFPKFKLNFNPYSAPVNSYHCYFPPFTKTWEFLFLSRLSSLECSHRCSIFYVQFSCRRKMILPCARYVFR